MIRNIILVGAGGFFGAVSRYIVYMAANKIYHKSHFPWGTLIVNLTGSFFIGLALGAAIKFNVLSRHTMGHYFLVTGFLGAFTTFSTFSQDNLILLMDKNYMSFAINIAANTIPGLTLAACGFLLVGGLDLLR
jgi:CrcB protein